MYVHILRLHFCFLFRLHHLKKWIIHTSLFICLYYRQQHFSQVWYIKIEFKNCMHEVGISIMIWTFAVYWYSTLVSFVSFLWWSDIKPADDVSHNWFDAQNQCLNHGLTIEKDKSDKPYWTGVYRRLTPWINILGQYLLHFFLFPLSSVNTFISYYI